jgi:transposase
VIEVNDSWRQPPRRLGRMIVRPSGKLRVSSRTRLSVDAAILSGAGSIGMLKEGLRHVFAVGGQHGKQALQRWLCWAKRCRIPRFVKVARTITAQLPAIHASLDHGLSNALI